MKYCPTCKRNWATGRICPYCDCDLLEINPEWQSLEGKPYYVPAICHPAAAAIVRRLNMKTDSDKSETFRIRIGGDTDIGGTIEWDGANWKAQGHNGEFPFYKDNRSLAVIGHLYARLSDR